MLRLWTDLSPETRQGHCLGELRNEGEFANPRFALEFCLWQNSTSGKDGGECYERERERERERAKTMPGSAKALRSGAFFKKFATGPALLAFIIKAV
jgi:hypothetical protein